MRGSACLDNRPSMLHSGWARSWQACRMCASVLFVSTCAWHVQSRATSGPRKAWLNSRSAQDAKFPPRPPLLPPSALGHSLTLPHSRYTIKKSWKKSITHLTGFNDCTWRSWEPMSHAASGNTVPFYCFVTVDSRGILIHFWWNVAFKSLHLSSASWSCLPGPRTILMWALLKSLMIAISYSFCWLTKVRFISFFKLKKKSH